MRYLTILLLASIALGLGAPATAQEATPAAAIPILAAKGYPELRVRVSGAAFDMPVTTIPAGRTMIALENAGQEPWHGFLLRLPEGVAIDALMAATPGPGEEPPSWLFTAS